jgi:hypothetical protein
MPAAELMVVGAVAGSLLGLGLGLDRPVDQIEHEPDRDLQDHSQKEDR